MNLSDQERAMYDRWDMNERREQGILKTAIDKGRVEGEQVGRVEDAIRMIRRDLDDDLIEEITQLPAAEIERLRKTHNDTTE